MNLRFPIVIKAKDAYPPCFFWRWARGDQKHFSIHDLHDQLLAPECVFLNSSASPRVNIKNCDLVALRWMSRVDETVGGGGKGQWWVNTQNLLAGSDAMKEEVTGRGKMADCETVVKGKPLHFQNSLLQLVMPELLS